MQLKKIPLPFCGVALGFAALGNLLSTYSFGPLVKNICGGISVFILIILIIKFLTDMNGFKEDMKNPIMASVFGTFSMAMMILGGYQVPHPAFAKALWCLGIIIHLILIIYFTMTFVVKFDLKKVFASWFIVYVGIVASSINSKALGMQNLGQIFFWFGFIAVLILLVVVTKRYLTLKEIPDPAKPIFCIYTAPVSLCLAGYMQAFDQKNAVLIYFMAMLSILLYIIVLINLPKFLSLPFFPSYAAFTFPFVISAIAIKMATNFFNNVNPGLASVTKILFNIQTWIAVVLVVYTLLRYLGFIFSKPNK